MLGLVRSQCGINVAKKLCKQSLSFSIPLPVLALNQIHHKRTTSTTPTSSNESSSTVSKDTQIPQYDRPMKKPIITGRRSDDPGQEPHGELKDEYPNPFVGKELPYGRKIIFDNLMEEDLANGQHWHVYNDRFMQHFDIDFVERGWGNLDLYKSPMAKRGCDDITMSHDMDYHFRLHNIGMHLEMMQYIPHLKPLIPEFKAEFNAVAGKWQDIVEEVLGDDSDDTTEEREEEFEESETTEEITNDGEYEKKTMKIETKRTKTKLKVKRKKIGSYKLNTTIIEDRPKVGQEVIEERRRQIKEAQNPSLRFGGDENKLRRDFIKREIELNTIKKFVDDKVEEKDFVRLTFVDAMGTKYFVYGMIGETLLQCCRRYLIPIDGYCNGYDRGIVRIYGRGPWCHLCQMDISPKYMNVIPPFDWRERAAFVNFRHITPTSRLGCCIWIRPEFDNMLINIPVSIPNPYGRFQD